jgi:hypothetical protein
MKMDRNVNSDGRGKYALVLMRQYPNGTRKAVVDAAMQVLTDAGMLDYGEARSPAEFFLIRLKDRFAGDALRAYADAAKKYADSLFAADDEVGHRSMVGWAVEVLKLAGRAGDMSDHCKTPD